MLVNIQPLGESMDLEVRLGSELRPGVGHVWDDAETLKDMRSSHGTLTALAADGLFVRRSRTTFFLEFHFQSASDWQEFLARPKTGRVDADPALLASVLAHPDGRIVVTEKTAVTVDECRP